MGKHLPGIDGLRAFAVLSVVAYHAGLPLAAGYVGVDVFFVISGYLITRILLERPSLVEFYARRARRILPAAFLVVLVTLGLSALLLPSSGDVARSAAAAGVFVANLHFQAVTGGYWSADAASMPLLHLWSLSVEEQFYLLWPLVVFAGRKWLPWLFGVSLGLYAWLSYADPNAAFYQTPARAWELAAGGLVAVGAIRSRSPNMGLALILLACLAPMPVPVATGLAVLGATLVVAAVHAGQRIPVLELRPMVWVGLISYSLYLWHWPLLAIDRALRVGEAPLSVRIALVAVSFVLAGMTYRYVEQPFRRMQVRPWRALALGATCAAALSCTAFVMADTKPVVKVADVHCNGPLRPMRCVSSPKVVLWGDSFAGAWEGYALAQGAPVVRAVVTSCPPVAIDVPRGAPEVGADCRRRAEQTIAYLQTHGADTLVIAGHWARLLRERPEAGTVLLAQLRSLSNVRRIVVVGATPEVRDSVEKCIALGEPCDITRSEYERAAAATKRMTAAMDRLPNVEILELGDFMCDPDKCRGVRNGVALYMHDNHHASHAAVAAFTRSLRTE